MISNGFKADKKTVNAVIRSLEIILEATGRIPKDVRRRYPDVPWDEIIGMRNRLIGTTLLMQRTPEMLCVNWGLFSEVLTKALTKPKKEALAKKGEGFVNG